MINFANAQYIFLLLLIPLFFVLYGIRRRMRRRRIARMGDPALVNGLMPSVSRSKGWVRLSLFSAAADARVSRRGGGPKRSTTSRNMGAAICNRCMDAGLLSGYLCSEQSLLNI